MRERPQYVENILIRRLMIVASTFVLLFAGVGVKLVSLGLESGRTEAARLAKVAPQLERPKLTDRHGSLLATNIEVSSVVVDPELIFNPYYKNNINERTNLDRTVEQIHAILPTLNRDWLKRRLSSGKNYALIKRKVTVAQQQALLDLGVPGLRFEPARTRFYPAAQATAHIVGRVNVDNVGTAGMEHFLNNVPPKTARNRLGDIEIKPVALSVDLRVQHAVRAELTDAIARYRALGGAGLVLDVRTGEVLALVSYPEFNPNQPVGKKGDPFSQITAGSYEVGSTMKVVTMAAALESGLVSIHDTFDATDPIPIGRFRIRDSYPKSRVLSLPEVFRYSSNIGTVKVMQAMGKDTLRAFMDRVHLSGKPQLELPERRAAKFPKRWPEISAMTASFGHGFQTTPLQLASAIAALMNGGHYIPPTLFVRNELEALAVSEPVISEHTSKQLRYLMRLNAMKGSGKRADIKGYRVGGKTGTAQKVVNGRYSQTEHQNTFVAAFPMDEPRYLVLTFLDDPKPEKPGGGVNAGSNAGPTAGRIIERIAPLLGVEPKFDPQLDDNLVPAGL